MVEIRTRRALSRASDRREPSHEHRYQEPELIQKGGQVVYHWPTTVSVDQARVLVYEMPPRPARPVQIAGRKSPPAH